MTRIVKLGRNWTIGGQLGSGGFGRVFEATDENGCKAVAKFVAKAPGADREMLFVNLAGIRNVVPAIDQGEDGDSWVIVMPRASKSLRDHLRETGGALPLDQAIPILTDVAQTLEDLAPRVVHRDLKPENVLLLDGRWCLADFGIARYADATTGDVTWKGFMTKAYAAPEIWRDEHATVAADVYSFGVLAYEMLTGRVPFPGPDFRAQHLTQDPPVPNLPAAVTSVVMECLYKPAGSRPTAAKIATRIPGVLLPASGAMAKLQAANQAVVVAQSKAAASQSAAMQETERRAALFAAASTSLKGIVDVLWEQISEGAPATRRAVHHQMLLAIELNQAALSVTVPKPVTAGVWGRRDIDLDAIASCKVRLHIPRNQYGYSGRSHSLWFCDGRDPGVYRWFETAFMHGTFSRRVSEEEPFAFDPGEEAADAIGPGIGAYAVDWPPTPVDQGEHADFIEHWIEWFARAGLGELNHPSGMPERSGPPFRK